MSDHIPTTAELDEAYERALRMRLPMAGRCDACKHWDRYPWGEDEDRAYHGGEMGMCGAMEESHKDWVKTRKAAVGNSYEESSFLLTRPDFGCVLWEPST